LRGAENGILERNTALSQEEYSREYAVHHKQACKGEAGEME